MAIIENVRKQILICKEKMRPTYDRAVECFNFAAGDQWEAGDLKERERSKRPKLTINIISKYASYITNKLFMEKAKIKVLPAEDTDAKKAEIINGILRYIENNDQYGYNEAILWAISCLVIGGFGYIRVDTEYENEKSFNKDIYFRKILNPFNTFVDTNDEFAISINVMSKEKFKQTYKDDPSDDDWDYDNTLFNKKDDETVIVEYFTKEQTQTTLYKIRLLPDIIPINNLPIDNLIDSHISPQKEPDILYKTKEELNTLPDRMFEVIETRETTASQIKHYIINGDKIIVEEDWPGNYIPIVGIFAPIAITSTGEIYHKSLIYDGLDPQRLYNYYTSQGVEILQAQPKNQWLGARGAFAGLEQQYQEANLYPTTTLEYNPITVEGTLAPPPIKQPPPNMTPAYFSFMAAAREDVKEAIGIFSANLGQISNEVSGRAIIARKTQGDLLTLHFNIALNQALLKIGTIILDLIPHIYDTARSVRIMGENMIEDIVKINQPYIDNTNTPVLYDMKDGKYDVVIDITNTNFLTRRQEIANTLIEFSRVLPQIATLGADIIVKNLDCEDSDELSMRLKAAIANQMPGLFETVEMLKQTKGKESILIVKLRQLQNQLQNTMQSMKQLTTENQILKQQLDANKIREKELDVVKTMQKENIKAETAVKKEMLKNPQLATSIMAGLTNSKEVL